jgi:adenine phosphoribosyltransferase
MSLQLFKQSLQSASIIKKGDYSYIVHPISEGIPKIDPQMLQEITLEMKQHIKKWGSIDKILTIESMGIPLATALSLELGIPFTIIRKRSYGFSDEICVTQKTGYSTAKLYINGVTNDEKVVIVDDLISTGGTLESVLLGLQQHNVDVKGVIIAVNKGNEVKEIKKRFNIPIITLVTIAINENNVEIK